MKAGTPAAASQANILRVLDGDAPTHAVTTFVCVMDAFDPARVRGWAVDAHKHTGAVNFHVLIDGQDIGPVVCDLPRPDLKETGYPLTIGYEFAIPARFLDGQPHRLELRVRHQPHAPLPFIHKGQERLWLDFQERPRAPIRSHVDDIDRGAIVGWVLREDTEGRLRGGETLLITCEGETVGYVKANRFRPDTAAAHAADAYCGFRFVPPPRFRSPRPRAFRFFVLPERTELAGSPFVTSFVTDAREAKLIALAEAIDRADDALTEARLHLKSLLPRPQYSIETYGTWAGQYFSALRLRARGLGQPEDQPLVSIICPVFRPCLADFTAAVESVLAQTYPHWELILVDDASRSSALSAQIKAFAARDPRIKAIVRRRNGGISAATNTAIEHAAGAWVAFFDHDDLLVDVALEVMLAHAQRTGAEMLYSDEDKVDAAGHLSEPHLKPDWNYRLLLGNNYVCHLLMVRRTALDRVGALNPARDGAQDHDLVLRLAETLAPDRIHHVPEILYHWRKTEGSTASDQDAKPYVVAAGIAAVSAHLDRRGLPAQVDSPSGGTLYHVRWRFAEQPEVAIIIPFRDAAAETERCVESILKTTTYRNYRIILVDNWSTQPEALAFRDRIGADPRVRVMRVEEDFNYARLNNLAAAITDHAFLVLHNNDVFHADPDWLSRLVGEALSDATVAVVGAKLLYPTGYVQHAGVVLGTWGIAGHVHSGLPKDAPGYFGRAILAQEVSAVTGACMLVRATVFRALGGLDELELPVAFNDVDFCLKTRAAGHKVILAADCVAEHHESLSRGADDQPAKAARFRDECRTMAERWGDSLWSDPFYSPHFDLGGQPFWDLRDPQSGMGENSL